VLLLPVAALALFALFVPGTRRAVPSLLLALLGLISAVAVSRLELSSAGGVPVAVWAGPALSLFWLGLIGAVLVALDSMRRIAIPVGVLAGVTTGILAVPLLAGMHLGTAQIAPGTERILPAVVTAEAKTRPGIGTLVISAAPDGIAAAIQRGSGTTLDDASTLVSTESRITPEQKRIASLAGNLVSRSGLDARKALADAAVDFVVLTPGGDQQVLRRAADALDGNPDLTSVGQTASGQLWRLDDGGLAQAQAGPGPFDTAVGRTVLIGQAVVFGLTLLLGIPTSRRRRSRAGDPSGGEPASTFEENEEDHG